MSFGSGNYTHERKHVCFSTLPHGCTDAKECFKGVKHDVKVAWGQIFTLCVNVSKSLKPQGEN